MHSLTTAANAFIVKLLVDMIQAKRSAQRGFIDYDLLNTSGLFEVLEKANLWSLEQVLLGSELGNDDILFCYRRLRYVYSIRWA
jgi:hypothetical protein